MFSNNKDQITKRKVSYLQYTAFPYSIWISKQVKGWTGYFQILDASHIPSAIKTFPETQNMVFFPRSSIWNLLGEKIKLSSIRKRETYLEECSQPSLSGNRGKLGFTIINSDLKKSQLTLSPNGNVYKRVVLCCQARSFSKTLRWILSWNVMAVVWEGNCSSLLPSNSFAFLKSGGCLIWVKV